MRFGKGLVSRSPVVLLLFVLSLFFCTGSFAAGGHNAHWGYEGEEGPEHWAGISEEYKACSSGKSQSPVDIKDAAGADLKAITFNYKSSRINILNNGHTVQVNYDEGSSIEVDGVKYDLLQFHFHGPSEHTVKGEFSDMEMHLVHRDKDGNLAVVGVMMEVGTENEALSGVWANLPEEKSDAMTVKGAVEAEKLLPKDRSYYTYSGSLTTPPCTEGVKWLVLKNPVQLSGEQIEAFAGIIEENNRPVQPLHGRKVTGKQ